MTMPAVTKLGTTDANIRSALHAKRLRRARSQPDTLVIDELGLAHAKSRIDVAVINGCIHGYEIKSAKDTLDRLATPDRCLSPDAAEAHDRCRTEACRRHYERTRRRGAA